MFKFFLVTYWLIGCLCVGVTLGRYAHHCKLPDFAMHEVLVGVVIWPVTLIGSLYNQDTVDKCEK